MRVDPPETRHGAVEPRTPGLGGGYDDGSLGERVGEGLTHLGHLDAVQGLALNAVLTFDFEQSQDNNGQKGIFLCPG